MGKLLAHEIAHVIGINHDGEGNDCSPLTSSDRIMTPIVSHEVAVWSTCSRKAAIKYSKSGKDSCLYD